MEAVIAERSNAFGNCDGSERGILNEAGFTDGSECRRKNNRSEGETLPEARIAKRSNAFGNCYGSKRGTLMAIVMEVRDLQ